MPKELDSAIIQLLLVQSQCAHNGAQRGHNDRDGSWMAQCPTCGTVE